MELTEEEKEVFRKYDPDLTKTSDCWIREGLQSLFNFGDLDSLKVTLNYIKRMVLKVSEIENFNIDENESINTEELLHDLFKLEEKETLVDFDISNCSNFQKLKSYFDLLLKDKTAEESEFTLLEVEGLSNNIFNYFNKYVYDLSHLFNQLDYVLSDVEGVDNHFNDIDSSGVLDEGFDEDIDNLFIDIDPNGVLELEEDPYTPFEEEAENSPLFHSDYDFERDEVTEGNLRKALIFANSAFEIAKCYEEINNSHDYLSGIVRQKKLDEFYSNSEFCKDYDLIMSHDEHKNRYYFHGTQSLEAADSIMEQGLGMMRSDLSTTANIEFTKDELILFSRGIKGSASGGLIGRFAIVILDAPIVDGVEKNIVEQKDSKTQINFVSSGLQGFGEFNYIVKPENIVGYVDKLNKKVVFNPKYRNYKGINNSLADDMVEKMVSGEIDTNGQPIIPEDTNTDIKTKGFIKVGSLSIITILISIGILVLGIFLIK